MVKAPGLWFVGCVLSIWSYDSGSCATKDVSLADVVRFSGSGGPTNA